MLVLCSLHSHPLLLRMIPVYLWIWKTEEESLGRGGERREEVGVREGGGKEAGRQKGGWEEGRRGGRKE